MIYEINRTSFPHGTPAYQLNYLMNMIATTDDPVKVAEFEIAVEQAGEQLAEHLEDMLALRQNLMNSCEAIDLEIKRLQDLRNEREARAERLHRAVVHYMTITELKEVVTDRHTLRMKRNPPKVEIYNEELIPAEYLREAVKVITAVDKKSIGEALKAGADVPGCVLVQSTRLEVK